MKGFFVQNVVMEYPRAQAVADGVNCDYEVWRESARPSAAVCGPTVALQRMMPVSRAPLEMRAVRARHVAGLVVKPCWEGCSRAGPTRWTHFT